MLLICKSSNLAKLITACVVTFLGAFQVNGHEENFKSLVIYHPYLIKENNREALGFLSVENTSSKSEHLIKIIPQFSSGYRLWRRGDNDEFVEISLSSGVEIPSREAIYIDQDDFKLLFWGIDESLEWYDKHVATFIFRDAGAIELDFEVEE